LRSYSRVRFMLILIAAVAILCWACRETVRMLRLSARYDRTARYCEQAEAAALSRSDEFVRELERSKTNKINSPMSNWLADLNPKLSEDDAKTIVAHIREEAEIWSALKRAYRNASRFPWTKLPDRLQHWEPTAGGYDDDVAY
jgi:hypothetical protein